ncbi:alpha/beta hydrolase [Dyadobacter sp. 3J3]|uniref:carboxylesterase family protein n=1 Tax=Dyadobacter sp. 3J3 TaxID=2606600 RepID=UPI001357C4E0|nr:alpha/beta hydrolase [Dyadobacter sp. 3J3]
MLYNVCFRFLILIVTTSVFFSCASTSQPNPDGDKTDPMDTIAFPFPDTTAFAAINKTDSILGNSSRFGDVDIFPETALASKTGIYSKANDYTGKSVDLNFSFLAPISDTLKKRPFVLFVHEGAFLYGSLDNEIGKAKYFARKGYAVAAINYRLGFNGGSESNICGSNKQELVRTIYRAVQDTYAALFYFTSNAETLGIDVSQIFLAGSSAGNITISSLAYTKEADFEVLDPGIIKLLGALDPHQTTRRFKLRALLTSLGYGLLKGSSVSAVTIKPTIFFQRTGDNVLPYESGPLFFCSSYPVISGAKTTSDTLVKFKMPFELNYEKETGHLLSFPETYISQRYTLFVKRFWNKDYRQIISEKYTVISDKNIN